MLGVKIASLTPSHGKKNTTSRQARLFLFCLLGLEFMYSSHHSLLFLIKTTNSVSGGRGVSRRDAAKSANFCIANFDTAQQVPAHFLIMTHLSIFVLARASLATSSSLCSCHKERWVGCERVEGCGVVVWWGENSSLQEEKRHCADRTTKEKQSPVIACYQTENTDSKCMIEGERVCGAHVLPTSQGHRNHPSRVEARSKSRPGSCVPGGFNLGLDVTGGKQQGACC